MDRGSVVVPWEHWVCTQCLDDNPYAVWLIKLKCFKPMKYGHNYPQRRTLVSIEPKTMELVKVRPLPQLTILGRFTLCRYYPNCPEGDLCTYAHLSVEQETWNFKKTLLQGF